jgi:hypothetical protein
MSDDEQVTFILIKDILYTYRIYEMTIEYSE